MARQKWKEWAENEDNLNVLSAWARAGLTDEKIAKQIGISRSTLAEWKNKHKSIADALSSGKEFADRLVENSLYKMALGFYVNETKGFKLRTVEYSPEGRKCKEYEELKTIEERHYIDPDIKAAIFWLKNRMPETWKEHIAEIAAEEDGTGMLILTPAQAEVIKKEVRENEKENRGDAEKES